MPPDCASVFQCAGGTKRARRDSTAPAGWTGPRGEAEGEGEVGVEGDASAAPPAAESPAPGVPLAAPPPCCRRIDRANSSKAGRSAAAVAASVVDLTNQVCPSPGARMPASITLPSLPVIAIVRTSTPSTVVVVTVAASAASSIASSPI